MTPELRAKVEPHVGEMWGVLIALAAARSPSVYYALADEAKRLVAHIEEEHGDASREPRSVAETAKKP